MKVKYLVVIPLVLTTFVLNSCTKFDTSVKNEHNSCYSFIHQKDFYGIGNSGKDVEIDLEYPEFAEWSNAAIKINKAISANVFAKLELENVSDTTSYESFFNCVKDEYLKLRKDFPEAASIKIYQRTRCNISTFTESVISVYVNSQLYTGGAHGMEYREFINFDPVSGEQIDIMNHIDNKQVFVYLAEIKLREMLNMQTYDNWSDYTFLQDFKLPKNIGMTDSGYKLIYNPYEILSFAAGHTEIQITFDELNY